MPLGFIQLYWTRLSLNKISYLKSAMRMGINTYTCSHEPHNNVIKDFFKWGNKIKKETNGKIKNMNKRRKKWKRRNHIEMILKKYISNDKIFQNIFLLLCRRKRMKKCLLKNSNSVYCLFQNLYFHCKKYTIWGWKVLALIHFPKSG